MSTSQEAVEGLSERPVVALRYSNTNKSPYEVIGCLCSLIKERSRLLDVGCGTGSITNILCAERSLSAIGIEPHPERAAQAALHGIEVVTGIYTDEIVQKHGKFDYVLFADVLEHLVDPVEMLRSVKNALVLDGRVIASIPNVAHWTVRLRLLFGNFDYKPTGIMDATHLRWFTRKNVRRLFEAAGYDIVEFRSTAGGWVGAYRYTPLRLLSDDKRSAILARMCQIAPGLFSAQHIVSARLKRS